MKQIRKKKRRDVRKKTEASVGRNSSAEGQSREKGILSTDHSFTETDDADFTGKKKKQKERLQKKEKQAQRASKKVEKARENLPVKREYTLQRVFDEETGRARYKVVAVEKEKPFREAGIPGLTVRQIGRAGRGYIHNKVSEAEKENAAVEAAHQSERVGEDVYCFVKRHEEWKGRYQWVRVSKLEEKHFKKEVSFQYQKFLEENPQMKKKMLQKRIQKQKIKREYRRAKKKEDAAKAAGRSYEMTKSAVSAVKRKVQEAARRNAGILVAMGSVGLSLVMIMISVSSCGAIFADMQSTVLAASYLSRPAEIDAADLFFTRLELDLQNEIDRIETDYPGYDEYAYNLGEIGHDSFELIGYLSAVHTEFTAEEVEGELQELFNEMYTLAVTPDVETRVRTVTDPDTGEETEEEYEVSVLKVVLTVRPLQIITAEKMDAEQTEIYGMYEETKGLLQEFASPLDLYWYHYVSSYYGYRKNPVSGNEEFHRGVDIAVPAGTTVYAAHDGMVTTAAYDSRYGNYVVIEEGGYTTKYAHMDSIYVNAGQPVKKKEIIGLTGNTGSSTGSHLHIECLYNGEYYNPLFYFEAGEKTIYGEEPEGGVAGGSLVLPESYDDEVVRALLEEAARYLGYPYVWGGSSPSTSFDCSGFVCYVFTNSGVHDLPRTTAQGIYNQCTPVSPSAARPGDIIFFTGTYSSGNPVTHVGIYCGNGVMIHCGDPIKYSSINTPYWQNHFYGFGRL